MIKRLDLALINSSKGELTLETSAYYTIYGNGETYSTYRVDKRAQNTSACYTIHGGD